MILGLIFIRGGGGLLFGWLIFGRNLYKMFWFGLGRDVSVFMFGKNTGW